MFQMCIRYTQIKQNPKEKFDNTPKSSTLQGRKQSATVLILMLYKRLIALAEHTKNKTYSQGMLKAICLFLQTDFKKNCYLSFPAKSRLWIVKFLFQFHTLIYGVICFIPMCMLLLRKAINPRSNYRCKDTYCKPSP